MTTDTELIADLQSNIVGDPFPLMRKAADAIEALESEIQRQYACIRSHAEITHKAEDERDALVAQLAAAQGQEPSVPEGWKLVPIEPTEAMLEVGFFAENDVFDSAKTKRIHVWKDMLSAAPQPKEPK